MPTIHTLIRIHAPIEVCFDLARDISLHAHTAAHTRERAVAGVTHGLIGPGEWVTFEAVHFGIRQRLTARIVEFDPPHRFVDQMVRGAFRSMRHVHEFSPVADGTLMRDVLHWASPLGVLGRVADSILVERHLREFLWTRNRELKRIAEGRAGTIASET